MANAVHQYVSWPAELHHDAFVFQQTCFSMKYGKTQMKWMVTEQESISALCFSLAKDSQINSVLAPKGGSMITTNFSLLIRKF